MSENEYTRPPGTLSGFGAVRSLGASSLTTPATEIESETESPQTAENTAGPATSWQPGRGFAGFSGAVPTEASGPGAGPGSKTGSTSKKLSRRTVLVGALAAALVVGGGGFMVVKGMEEVPQALELPAVPDYKAPADQKPVGADGLSKIEDNKPPKLYPVENADTGGGEAGWISPAGTTPVTEMNTELMSNMSVFVPEAKLYSEARASDSFGQSKYAGLFSIAIPDNPHRTVWHSAGGAMADTNADGSPASVGTTFLGSHSGYQGLWGAYLHTAQLKGGETIWTKDANGALQRWQVNRIQYMPHTEFPQEYWKADGPRRLVLATCGGTVGADGIYNENVFVEAKPVNPDGSSWKAPAPAAELEIPEVQVVEPQAPAPEAPAEPVKPEDQPVGPLPVGASPDDMAARAAQDALDALLKK